LARPPRTWRPFNDALLNAYQMESTSETENQKTLFFSDRIGQRPIEMSIFGCEFYALVSKDLFNFLPDALVHALIKKSVHAAGYLPPWESNESEQPDPFLKPVE
ncbi:hypothetical protein BGX27_003364, partial [Mortierella sp. AM989]